MEPRTTGTGGSADARAIDRPGWFARFSSLVFRIAFTCSARLRLEGLEHLPASGAFILASNHASNADGLLLMGFVGPKVGRTIGWLGKEEALHWPVFGPAIRANGVFGVRRGAGDLDAFRTARAVLDEGRVLGMFPEGTRSPTGSLQEAKEGAALFAVRTGAPVLPVAIAGSHRFLPKGSFVPRVGTRITVRVGEPFVLHAGRGGRRRDSLRDATTELMAHIAALLPPEQRGVYAATVAAAAPAPGGIAAAGAPPAAAGALPAADDGVPADGATPEPETTR